MGDEPDKLALVGIARLVRLARRAVGPVELEAMASSPGGMSSAPLRICMPRAAGVIGPSKKEPVVDAAAERLPLPLPLPLPRFDDFELQRKPLDGHSNTYW